MFFCLPRPFSCRERFEIPSGAADADTSSLQHLNSEKDLDLGRANHPTPRVINADGHSAYPPAIVWLKAEGALDGDCRHRPVPYLNKILEQGHRAIKRRVNASQHFRSFGELGARSPAMRRSI